MAAVRPRFSQEEESSAQAHFTFQICWGAYKSNSNDIVRNESNMYHAGFCVLQERVIFQTHAGLLANTLKMKIGSEFSFLLKEGHGLAQAGGLAISAECKNWIWTTVTNWEHSKATQISIHFMSYWHTAWCVSSFHKLVVFQWPQISCAPLSLSGPPWCLLYWLVAWTGRSVCAQCPHAAT